VAEWLREHHRSDRALGFVDGVIAVALWTASFFVYFRTLFPYPLVGDSAEFQVLAAQVGVAHNPGYPIYMALAKLWTFLPAGDIAYRVNLFSAFMAAIAVAAVYLATTMLARERVAGIFAAAALAVSWTFWSQAVIAEVYTAGAAILSIMLAGLMAWYRTAKRWPLFVAGLCGALSLGVHSTTALLAPAVLVFLLIAWRGRSNPWVPSIGGVGAGLVIYLVVFALVDWNAPPASMFNASYIPGASSFGHHPADFDSVLGRMVFNGTAGQWRGAMYSAWDTLPARIAEYRAGFGREFATPVILLMVLGFALLCCRAPAVAALVGLGLVLEWSFVFTYRIGDYYVFYIAGYVLLVLLAGFAVGTIVRWSAQRAGRGARAVRVAALVLLLVVGVWPTLAPRWSDVVMGRVPFLNAPNYPATTQTVANYITITRTTEALPANSIVFVDWFRLYTYWYAAQIAEDRTDLRFIEPYTDYQRTRLPRSTVTFIREKLDDHPIFFEQPIFGLMGQGFRFDRVRIGSSDLFRVVEE
jgi:hypothetical protein